MKRILQMETDDTDLITIEGLEIFAHHGAYDFERQQGQVFVVNAILYTDLSVPGETDDLEQSTNYALICHQIEKSMTENTYDLIERAAHKVIEDILLNFPLIQKVRLELQKPHAPVGMDFENISVTVTRGWNRVYIAFGSNMGNRKELIENALNEIEHSASFRYVKVSGLYESAPYGGVEQEPFLNGVLEAQTWLTPKQLLRYLQSLEEKAGRIRALKWGPRTLDLDILFYNHLILEDPQLTIPHKDMANRDFVLTPLKELAAYYRHPVTGKTIEEMEGEVKERYCM